MGNSVPFTEIQAAVKFLEKYPDKYQVREFFHPDASCNGNTHCKTQILMTSVYRQKLCTFWSSVFDRDESFCALEHLPNFTAPQSSADRLHAIGILVLCLFFITTSV